ncbi:distal tail protein Dit [Gracilibacillus sp. JCM 18860]|uniref:distal tail protein Dit n=1 Tax=Gracilibacillus sp. JCM 18860 TaxID=1306159 RepID=UPI0006D176B4
MAYESITFNGIRKDWLYIERGRKNPPFAARRRNLLTVPGYPGGYLRSTEIQPLPIEQPVGFRIKDDADALAKKDELAEWLLTEKPVPLEFDDEPGRIYYAVVQNTLDDFEKMAVLRSGTIQFLCPDPYAYGPEIQFTAPSDYFSITNNGTAEAEPIFEFEVKEPVTFALIQNQFNEYNMIGRPINEGDIPVKPYDRIANLTLGTKNGWSDLTAGQVLSGGIVGGQMTTTGASFEAETFGTNPNGWVGPAVKRSFSETLQNFAIDIAVTSRNTQGITGKLQALLLDAADNEIATMTLIDGTIGGAEE